MRDVNKVILIGRLGADPVRRQTKNGVTVVNFPLATSHRIKAEGAAEGEASSVEQTQWHRVVAWGRQGQLCAEYLRKGNSVYVEGAVRSRKYDGKDGTARVAFEVHAEDVSFLGGSGRVSVDRVSQETEAGLVN